MLDDWHSRTDDPWNTLNSNKQAPDGRTHNDPTQPPKGEPNIIEITDLTPGSICGGDGGEATALLKGLSGCEDIERPPKNGG
jgi:hypothetical protein